MEDSRVITAKLQPEKTLFNTVQTLAVFVCVFLSLAQHVDDNLAIGTVIKEPPLTLCRHGHRCIVTSQEAGGGLAQRLLQRKVATCFCHLLFTSPPSISLHLSFPLKPIHLGPNTLVSPPFTCTFTWVRQVWREQQITRCQTYGKT